MLSARAASNARRTSPLAEGAAAAAADPYSPTNPHGVVNLGRAENSLMSAEVVAMLNLNLTPALLPYGLYHGSLSLRQNIANLFNSRLNLRNPLHSDNIAVSNGGTSVISCAAAVLADPTDKILLPTPVYGSFGRDVEAMAGVSAVPVNPGSNNEFPSLDQFDQALAANPEIKALLFANPGNPSGRIVPKIILVSWLRWANARRIHVIVDEVYMWSVWDSQAEFVSALEFGEDVIDSTLLHVVWSFSKDFCMNGMRAAAIISRNPEFMKAYKELSIFHAIPRVVDDGLALFSSDLGAIDSFISTNHERLRTCFDFVRSILNKHGIPYSPPSAGICIWINLSAYITYPSLMAIASRHGNCSPSMALFYRFLESGVYVAPGDAFYCDSKNAAQAGMVRMIVAMPMEVLKVGVARVIGVLDELRE
ncbi:hypothetical protein HDU98_006322 [Podochytrium sp. JEL0797]|nr:hypothetical protein HDU98_006322 [Podochytrium sp. JEL0797]